MDTTTAINEQRAIFAGGCFWCMEPPFDALDGVLKTTSGYIGGDTENPSYPEVSSGRTGHTEAIEIVYDANIIDYETLLNIFWQNIDPIDGGGQFCDRGTQYRSEIFYLNEAQQQAAYHSKEQTATQLSQAIATAITPASTFYPAEDYHQDYYLRNPIRYKFYRYRCGRDQRLKELWKK